MNNYIRDEQNNILCVQTPFIKDVSEKSITEILLEFSGVNDLNVEYLEDGTLVRLYNDGQDWKVATNNKEDAYKSYWSSNKSFGEMFWEIVDDKDQFVKVLDSNFTYFFVLLHVENIHVIKINKNSLVYLYSLNNKDETECKNFPIDSFVYVKTPIIHNFTMPFLKKRGIIFKYNNEYYKKDFDYFLMIKEARGNEPNILKRYLELLYDNDSKNIRILKRHYKNINFDSVLKFVNKLYTDYIESHIKKVKQITDEEILLLCKKLHYHYKTSNEKITKKIVIKILQNSL